MARHYLVRDYLVVFVVGCCVDPETVGMIGLVVAEIGSVVLVARFEDLVSRCRR